MSKIRGNFPLETRENTIAIAGFMGPKDLGSSLKISQLVQNTGIPVVTYSTAGLLGLTSQTHPDNQANTLIISSAPAIQQYFQVGIA